MLKRLAAGLSFFACGAFAQLSEKPVGIVITSDGAEVRPVGGRAPLTLAKDDYLFRGDTILTGAAGRAEIAFCENGSAYTLGGGGEFTIGAAEIRPSKGPALAAKAHPPCDLPAVTTDLASARRRGLVHPVALTERGQPPKPDELPLGPTYALVVGVSEYQKIAEKYWLQYADADARTFAGFLASPRGGGLTGEERIKVLTNAEATRDAVRNFIRLYLGKARATHGTFLLVIAAHGLVDEQTREAHILTHESEKEDLSSSALPMDEFADVLSEGLGGLGRMLLFVDVCHSAEIRGIRSNIKKNNVNAALQGAVKQLPGRIFSFVSSNETEPSYEGENWGGGHGAFTYFVLRGLNGDADKNADGIVSARELLDYVGTMVRDTTAGEQHPKELTVTLDGTALLAEGARAELGGSFEAYRGLTKQDRSGSRSRSRGQISAAKPSGAARSGEFEAALRAGRILPGVPGSAYELLGSQFVRDSATYQLAETELRVALENKAQEAVLQYLKGDQTQPNRESFRTAGLAFAAAQRLSPDSASVEGRRLFCEGRYAIFEKKYDDAVRLLGMAARIDPKGAYSYNALGIAYLEQSQFALATAAFEDAIRLAPYWVYPRHNLALALAEQGRYDRAIAGYRDAMKFGPDYSYLPYNLGLLYQRLNRLSDAEESYRLALEIAEAARRTGVRPAAAGHWQEGADILNALGSLEAARSGARHRRQAEELYRQALSSDTESRAARHNLALLLSRDGPSPEAEALWRQNLREAPDEVVYRLPLARYLSRIARGADAVEEFRLAIASGGATPGIRRELATVYVGLRRTGEARTELEQAAREAPGSGQVLEDLGDLERDAGQTAQAEGRYREAQSAYPSERDRMRVQKKIERLRAGRRPA